MTLEHYAENESVVIVPRQKVFAGVWWICFHIDAEKIEICRIIT